MNKYIYAFLLLISMTFVYSETVDDLLKTHLKLMNVKIKNDINKTYHMPKVILKAIHGFQIKRIDFLIDQDLVSFKESEKRIIKGFRLCGITYDSVCLIFVQTGAKKYFYINQSLFL